jgi:endoglycosylceramidase
MHKALLFAILLLMLVMVTACTPLTENPVEPSKPLFYVEDGSIIRNPAGYAILLRGVNARVDGIFDASFDTGRPPNLHLPVFTDADAAQMAAWGFNFLRLPINWSGIEPEQGSFDGAYVDRIRAVVEMCERHGIYVQLDFHQDGFSKWIGEDGAPLWAIRPPPPEDYISEATHVSGVILEAVDNFWKNVDGMQDAWAAAVLHIDREFREAPNVVGIQFMNEPIAGLDHRTVLPFYQRIIDLVETENDQRLWFFEPSAVRNQLDKSPRSPEPFPRANAVYSPHIYTNVFSLNPSNFESGDTGPLKESMKNADLEARAWNTPLLVGEWGMDPEAPNAMLWYRTQVDLHNQYLAHSSVWVWKEFGDWGLHSHNGAITDTVWTPRLDLLKNMSTPYPQEVEGKLTALSFDREAVSAEAIVELTGEGRIQWGIPPSWFPKGVVMSCDGEVIEPESVREGSLIVYCPAGTRLTSVQAVK